MTIDYTISSVKLTTKFRTISMAKEYYVYIMANGHNTTLYVGVTSNLEGRVYQHRKKLIRGFTSKYNVSKLVYYEVFSDPESAILREKQIKGGSRSKMDLVDNMNPLWKDLYEEF